MTPRTPLDWKLEVWRLDDGKCVHCRREVPLKAGRWVWQAHHVLKQQWLRDMHREDLLWDVRMGVLLCFRCHGRHESGMERVSWWELPPRCRIFIEDLGGWALGRIARYHPKT